MYLVHLLPGQYEDELVSNNFIFSDFSLPETEQIPASVITKA